MKKWLHDLWEIDATYFQESAMAASELTGYAACNSHLHWSIMLSISRDS